MTEVLVGTEWVSVAESSKAIEEDLARARDRGPQRPDDPMACTIELTLPGENGHGRRTMTVGISAVFALRD